LYDGTGTTALRPTSRWEIRVDVEFLDNCSAASGSDRVFANAVTDFVHAPFEQGKVSVYPQTAATGCELWRFSLSWDGLAGQCTLNVHLRDFGLCSAPLDLSKGTVQSIIDDYRTSVAREIDVHFSAAIPTFSAPSKHSLIVRIKDPSVNTAFILQPGPVVVATSDGTEFELFWNGALLSDAASAQTGSYANIVVPNSFLPDGQTDVLLYTVYTAWFAQDNASYHLGDRVTSFLYSYDIVFAAGRRRRMQEVVESHKYITISDDSRAICACTDGVADTPCLTAGSENAWIKFDLGTAVHVKGLELVAWSDGIESPNPPPNPPPQVPPSPPPSPPKPPPPPVLSPFPKPPPSPPFCKYIILNNCTVNFVDHTRDGVCDGTH
jgi:hypothetical protein